MTIRKQLPIIVALFLSGGCGKQYSESFDLKFKLVSNNRSISCDAMVTELGPEKTHAIGINDVRFFISQLHFYDANNKRIPIKLDNSVFQYSDSSGSIALIDFTDNKTGSCSTTAMPSSEGTSRINQHITGKLEVPYTQDDVHRIDFDAGLSQTMMKSVLSNHSAEDAPPPLDQLQWSWAAGYRHFIFNFLVFDQDDTQGEGHIHLGSRGCGSDGLLALENKTHCDYINTPKVRIDGINITHNTVSVDISNLLSQIAFSNPIYDLEPPNQLLSKGLGVACHASPIEIQADCGPVFSNFGLDHKTGNADYRKNSVFGYQ